MKKGEAKKFIEEMNDYGDFYWDSDEEVINAYKDKTLYDALEERKSELDSEAVTSYEAALYWGSRGKDEDYTFEHTEEELEDIF